MRAILIIAHGTPRPAANADILEVAETVRARRQWDLVVIGYLDCNEPDIGTAVDQCVESGASYIAAVPYFLHTGKHVLLDIPAALRCAASRHPQITFALGDYLGNQPQIEDVLRDRYLAATRRPG